MRNPLDPGFYVSEELRSFGFKVVGENVQISRDCTIIGPQNISFGDHIRIDSATTIVATTGQIVFEGINHIGGHCHFCAAADLIFGEFSGTSQGVRIYTANDDYSGRRLMGPMVPPDLRGAKIAAVRLGRFAVMGSNSVILPGCHLGEGTAIGALSLVTHALRPWGIYHGNPARRIHERARDIEGLARIAKTRLAAPEAACA